MIKKKQGLGNMQKTQQKETMVRVLDFISAGEKTHSYFREIQRRTRISPLSLKKALERLVKENMLLEMSGVVRTSKNKRQYSTPAKLFYLSTVENKAYLEKIKKDRQDNIKNHQKYLKKQQKHQEQRNKNRLIKQYNPISVRDQIAKALVKIVYLEEDENHVLEEVGITKKTFETWIKRSPRLEKIRKLLYEYKNNNQDLPFSKRNNQYKIPYSAIWIKRELMFPKPTKQKYHQWIRK